MRQVMLVVFYFKFTTEPSILQTWWHYILSNSLLCGRPHWGAFGEIKMKKKSFTVLAFFLISTFIFAAAVVLLHSTLSSCATNKAQNPLRAMLAEIVVLFCQ